MPLGSMLGGTKAHASDGVRRAPCRRGAGGLRLPPARRAVRGPTTWPPPLRWRSTSFTSSPVWRATTKWTHDPVLSSLTPLLPAPARLAPQVKPPCSANATQEFVQASPSANFAGKPDRTARLGAKQGVATCKALCARAAAAGGAAPKAGADKPGAGCAAFSLSVSARSSRPGRAARQCNFWIAVPDQLCAPGESEDLCGEQSEGSFRVRFAPA